MVITKVLVHFCPPSPINFCPPYIILSLLVISFSLSLPARLSFYLFLSHLVSGNRIEARQWIVARHLSCYNPLSCFSPFCGVTYDKIKFHEFFCVCNFFSFSPVSLSPSLSLSLSHPVSLSFSLPSLSLFLSFFSRSCLSFHLSLSHPCRLPLLLPLMSPCLSFSHPCLQFSLFVAVSLFLPPPVSLPISLCPTMPLFFGGSLSLSPPLLSVLISFSLSLSLSLSLVFKILSSFVRDSSYHDMYYKGCGLLCAHKKSFNTAIPVRSLGPYTYVHYCTCIVHILVWPYLFHLTSFFDYLSFMWIVFKTSI